MVAPSSPSENSATTHMSDENDVGTKMVLSADDRHRQDDGGVASSRNRSTTSVLLRSNSSPTNAAVRPDWCKGMTVGEPLTATAAQSKLEERVQELEIKLATLSLLLQQQQRRLTHPSSLSPSATPPASPGGSDEHKRATPALDSPAPPDRNMHTRHLSRRILYGGEPASGTDDASGLYIPGDPDPGPGLCIDANDGEPAKTKSNVKARFAETLVTSDERNEPSKCTKDAPGTGQDETVDESHKTNVNEKNEAVVSANTARFSRKRSDSLNVGDIRSKWLDYLNSFQESTHDVDQQMEEFIKVPGAVEALLSYGFWICVDSFLYLLTILPIRFVWSCLLLANHVLARAFKWNSAFNGPFRFHRRHVYQLIQVGIIYSVYKYVLMPVSIGKLYHWIRGQSMVKLYVLIAIVEVFDRMMCSLGQDCLDSLYWNTTRRPRSSRMATSIVVVLVYTTIHSCLLFIHVATLNVAMNSADQALLTLLISGNFAEIKSTVFKKYNKPNLFKITASDICERFKLALFLGLVLILNLSQGMDQQMVWSYIQMCGIVWCAEWLADWIKHSFITKFNFIPSSIYPEYALLLAGDVTGFGHEGVNLDHSHAVVRRIGLAQLPLVCVMARYIREAVKYASDAEIIPLNWKLGFGMIVLWTFVLAWKMSLGSFLHKISLAKLKHLPALSKNKTSPSKKTK